MSGALLLDRDPLHGIPGDQAFGAVVEAGRAGVGVPEKVLDVLKGDTLVDEVRGRRGPERVTAEFCRRGG